MRTGPMPVPVSATATDSGVAGLAAIMFSDAVFAPFDVGVNATLTVQLPPTPAGRVMGNVVEQVPPGTTAY